NPADFIPQLVIWSTFYIFATCALVPLFIITVVVQGLRTSATLLSLQLSFILASGAASALIWTGHARDLNPPFELCLINASAIMSNIPLNGGAALSLVVNVWGAAMIIWHPRVRPVMQWITWTPILILFPWIFSLPLFIAGIVVGLQDRTKVFRGSPFYCVLDDSLQTISAALGAVLALTTLILATWTSINLFINRRRVGSSRFSENSNISYTFTSRVIVFSIFVGAAFVAGIVALSSSFDAVIPDIIVASLGVAVFFIFASA
ncbi:hypothetical protein B0H17DRAFT_898265, partial [Mycena rosella]